MNRSVLSFFLLLASCASAAIAGPPRPNVVLILSDDQAWGDYSFMGHPSIETPHLDRLARESLTFTRGYVPTSLCRPSLATIISGLYPHQHGIVGNDPPWVPMGNRKGKPPYNQPGYMKAREDFYQHIDALKTLPDYVASLGYRSLQTGKWWEGNYSRGGFDEGMTVGDMTKGGRHGDVGLTIGRDTMEPIATFLDSCSDQSVPFLLWYAPMLPHTPHNPPERLFAKYRPKTDSPWIAKYWAMCEWFDESCGELLKMIDDRGMTDNTIVVYVTDNGWINLPDQSAFAPRSKRSPNEGGIRTPIMIKWPGKIQPVIDQESLASSIDIVPTLLGELGIEPEIKLPGINLLDEKARQSRDTLFGEIFEHDIVAMDNPDASLRHRWVIQGHYKLIDPSPRLANEQPELYDLSMDPHEETNLAVQKPDLLDQLRDLLHSQ